MTNPKKIGGLLLILAVPLLILVFLEQFGKQHYAIPTDPAEAEGLSAEVPAGSLGQAFRLPKSWRDAEGSVISEEVFSRKILIIYCESTMRSDTAALILEKLTRVQNVFEQDTLVRLITIIPTKRLSSLRELAQRYRAQPKVWTFLADTTPGSVSLKLLSEGTNAATLMLVDQAQRVRGYYDGTKEREMDRLVAEARILLYDVK